MLGGDASVTSVLTVLREVADLLGREGRLSLRLIRREYDLSDDDLDTIVEELTVVRGAATLDAGVLIATAPSASPASSGTAPIDALSPGETEHRDLTVLFCDLVGSTELSTRLDAEDFSDAIRAYTERMTAVVERFGGHVANLMGDGLLVLFGYPTAHDDSARQGVAAALAAVAEVGELQLGFDIRAGLHIGPVAVSNVGPGGRSGALALGETVNVAARVESAATPGGVYVTDDLARVVDGWFEFESAGFPHLKGVDRPIEIHRVTAATGARTAIEARSTRSVAALTGRQHEFDAMRAAWERAQAGSGRLVAIVGEPGIGKSRLVEEMRHHVMAGDEATWRAATCSPYATATALHPFASIGEFAEIAGATPPDHLGPDGRRRWLLQRLADAILDEPSSSSGGGHVLLIDDLHWADSTSIELVDLVRRRIADHRLLMLVTSRESLPDGWVDDGAMQIGLTSLDARSCRRLIDHLSEANRLSEAASTSIIERAGGNPLYLEELVYSLTEQRQPDDGDPIADPSAIPTALQTPLLARLDGLGAAKPIAQAASVIGRVFTEAGVTAIVEPPLRSLVPDAIEQMTTTGLIVDDGDGAPHQFRHALLRDAAYHSLLKKQRRRLHGHVVDRWMDDDDAVSDITVEAAARHAVAAERHADAVALHGRAGREAAARSANAEARQHFEFALGALDQLDDSGRLELELRRSLASSLVALSGYLHADTIATWERTRELAMALDDPHEVTSSLLGLAITRYGAGDLAGANELIAEALAGAEEADDDGQRVVAHTERAMTSYFGGDFEGALTNSATAAALYRPEDHHRRIVELVGDDSGVAGSAVHAWALMQVGRLDEATEQARAAIDLAESVDHPFSVAQARLWAMLTFLDLGIADPDEVDDLVAFCDEQGFALWGGSARVVAATLTGDHDGYVEGRDLASTTASLVMAPAIVGLEADIHLATGEVDRALAALDLAIGLSGGMQLPFYDARLLWRTATVLSQSGDDTERSDTLLSDALAVADAQGSRWYALLAATTIAERLEARGQADEARRLLAERLEPIEGGDRIPAVVAARLLLTDLTNHDTEATT